MTPRRIRDLLDRIGCLGHPCDLDLLLFFHRHPRAVLTSERLTVYVGYELSRVAQSLEVLIAAGLLTRAQRPTGSARVYLLSSSGRLKGWLDALMRVASTRAGRLAVIAALSEVRSAGEAPSPPASTLRGPRDPVRGTPDSQRMEAGYA